MKTNKTKTIACAKMWAKPSPSNQTAGYVPTFCDHSMSREENRMSNYDNAKMMITPEIEALIEDIAKEVHASWVNLRSQDGWTYGPKRDDDTKQTPCMVPYDELPEDEKQYDRNTAQCTILALLAKGYKLIPPEKGGK